MWPARLREESSHGFGRILPSGKPTRKSDAIAAHVEGQLMLDLGSGQPMAARVLATSLHAAAVRGLTSTTRLGIQPLRVRRWMLRRQCGGCRMAVRADIMECSAISEPVHAVVIGGIDQDIVPI